MLLSELTKWPEQLELHGDVTELSDQSDVTKLLSDLLSDQSYMVSYY